MTKRTFADIAASYKRYDPAKEGFGSPSDWTGVFYERMGFEQAEQVLHGKNKTPRQILGVAQGASWKDVVSAFRKLAMQVHPDRIAITGMDLNKATEAFKELNAAYSVLAREYGQ